MGVSVSEAGAYQTALPPPLQRSRLISILRGLAVAAFVVALPTLVVTSIVRVLVSDVGFYERGLRVHDSEARTGVPLAELEYAAAEIVEYFENDADQLNIVVVVNGEERQLFNDREIRHMEDVKSLIRQVFTVQEAALVYSMAYVAGVFLWARERTLRALAWQALAAMGIGLMVVMAIGALALSGFDEVWTQFHEIAFRNDLWRLNPATDSLIQMFPETFWAEATFFVGVGSAGVAVVVVLTAGSFLLWSGGSGRRSEMDAD